MHALRTRLTTPTLALLVLLPAAGLAAQVRQPARAQQLRQRIEQQFLQRLVTDLRLGDDQATRLEGVLGQWGEHRRGLETEERELRRAVSDQLRPGIAADTTALSRNLDRLLANRVAYAESFQGEMAELKDLLSPVQRAQFLLMRDQILRRAQELMQERQPPPGRQ